MIISKICGVALFSASCSNQPALRRAVPHSEVPAAVNANGAVSTDQTAISTVCRTCVSVLMTSTTKASISAGGIHGAPNRAVMSDGRRSSGWTSLSAATLRAYWGSRSAAASAMTSFGADGPRQVGVVGLPGFRGRVTEHRLAKLGQHGRGIAVQQFGEVVDIDATGLVERDGESIGGGRNSWHSWRGDHPFAENWPMRARPLSRS